MHGNLICFEGIDGVGKRTQTALLSEKLEGLGIKAKSYTYPDYPSVYGQIIRSYLDGNMALGRMEHFMLFLIDIMKDKSSINEDLVGGNVVIMDRYLYTAIAYICPSGLDYSKAKKFMGLMDLPRPSTVFYLSMPAKLVSERKIGQKGNLDKFERDTKFLDDVKKFYGKMMKEKYLCNDWIKVDASRSIEEVHKDVISSLNKTILKGK
ncbi:MAG: dTMP kinase [Candidatus Micrarchaeota archaeon]|nr:dTMP kinase [Candidatus Micrarchaeota archaeon]